MKRSAPATPKPTRSKQWLKEHWGSLCIIIPLLTVVAIVHTINFDGYPSNAVDDEGTYMAQAWAILHNGEIAHYTYWYDHPFIGWVMLVPFLWVAESFGRDISTVTIGREAMIVFNLVSCVLLYVLARRLRFNRGFAALAVGLFALSPLAVHYHRMVFLDNISTMLIIAAMVLAASPRRSIWATIGSAVCTAIAFWTKETALILLIPVVYVLVQNIARRQRGLALTQYFTVLGVIGLAYPLFALLKGELLPGGSHVSLYDAIKWQLFERSSDGSLLDTGSNTFGMARWWFTMDPYLLGIGVFAIAPVILAMMAGIVPRFQHTLYASNMRRLRPLAAGLAIQIVMMFRDGYMPYPYVIAMLPFAALLIAGVIDSHWHLRINLAWPRHTKSLSPIRLLPRMAFNRVFAAVSLAAVVALGISAAPKWHNDLNYQFTSNETDPWRQAVEWVATNLPTDALIVVDDVLWPDLARMGYTRHEWVDKVDLDPAVNAKLPNGWRDIDYVILKPFNDAKVADIPTVVAAIDHSEEVAVFGEDVLFVHRVNK